jgi:chemotaxis protein CheD
MARVLKPATPDAARALPQALPQFQHVRRFWTPDADLPCAKLLPGDYYVTTHDEMVFTVLGSCVSACVRDRVLGIGGMNHFMLPLETKHLKQGTTSLSAATRFGNVAMERLVNDILKCGGRREQMEVKVVGGGRVIGEMSDIGARNVAFIADYLHAEGLRVLGEDVGGTHARKVQYFPATGRTRVQHLRDVFKGDLYYREKSYLDTLAREPAAGTVEMF